MPEFHILDKRDFDDKHDQNKDGKLDLVSILHKRKYFEKKGKEI